MFNAFEEANLVLNLAFKIQQSNLALNLIQLLNKTFIEKIMKKTFLGLFFRVPIPFKTYQNTWYVMALGTYLLNFCVSKVLVLQKKFALSLRINLHIIKYRLIY